MIHNYVQKLLHQSHVLVVGSSFCEQIEVQNKDKSFKCFKYN